MFQREPAFKALKMLQCLEL